MNNQNLELQKIIINCLNNIDFLKEHNIKSYSSIPDNKNLPYIKLSTITMNTRQNISNIKNFTIELTIITEWKNNSKLLEIIEHIHKNITKKIEEYILYEDNININIYNIYNLNFKIKEDLINNVWLGYFYIDIDVI